MSYKAKDGFAHPTRFVERRFQCVALDFAASVLEVLDGDVKNTVLTALRDNNHSAIPEVGINPSHYSDWRLFRDDYLAASLLSKFPALSTDIDRKAVALEKFRNYEATCADSNIRIRRLWRSDTTASSDVRKVFNLAREKIHKLLPVFDWDVIEPCFRFGKGSTTRLRRVNGDSYYKLRGKPEVTANAAGLARVAIARVPRWQEAATHGGPDTVVLVPGDSITTVPKNATTDRTIGIPPDCNVYLQRGVGVFLARILKRVGVHLDNQSLNQELARLGSIDGSLATIDLKGASDCVSISLVEWFLPDDWFIALSQVRSQRYVLDWRRGSDPARVKSYAYNKFSAMGNGFTFELESLIFWAIQSACIDLARCSDRRFAVYGDDLICPTAAVPLLLESLQFAGFTPNEKKTFTTGPFRESCGKHFFRGHDVTPFYLREEVEDSASLIRVLNALRRFATDRVFGCADKRFEHVWEYFRQFLPVVRRRVSIPLFFDDSNHHQNYGDSALGGNLDEAVPTLPKQRVRLRGRQYSLAFLGWEGWVCKVISEVTALVQPGDDAYLLRQLYLHHVKGDVASDARSDGIPLIKKGHIVRELRWSTLHVHRWGGSGPWV